MPEEWLTKVTQLIKGSTGMRTGAFWSLIFESLEVVRISRRQSYMSELLESCNSTLDFPFLWINARNSQ